MFVEAILNEEQSPSAERSLPVYLELIDRELSSRLQAADQDSRAANAGARDVEALPLHLALTPPQLMGQVEVLNPEEMMEFQKEFAVYDARTQMAKFDPIHNTYTPTRCVDTETCYSCGIGVPDFCEGPDDLSNQ